MAGNVGGITRDVLIGSVPPAAISDWRYLAVSLLAGVITFYSYSVVDRLRSPVLVFDAVGLRPIASMGSAISSGTSAKPVKAMYSASIPIIGLHHGASRNGLPAPPRRSPRRSDDRTGGVYRPAPEPKDHDCMTGATSNWPISKVKTPTITARSFGHEAC